VLAKHVRCSGCWRALRQRYRRIHGEHGNAAECLRIRVPSDRCSGVGDLCNTIGNDWTCNSALKITCLSCASVSTASTVPSLHYFDTSWSERTHLKKSRSRAPGFHKSALSTVVILHGSAVIHTFKNGGTSLLKVASDHGGTVKTIFSLAKLTRQQVVDFLSTMMDSRLL